MGATAGNKAGRCKSTFETPMEDVLQGKNKSVSLKSPHIGFALLLNNFASILLERVQSMRSLYANPAFILSAEDVKNFFSELRHDTIIKSVHWLIETCRHLSHRRLKHDRISIYMKEKGRDHYGYSNDDQSRTLTFPTIIEIVEFGLNNVTFVVNGVVYKQVI